VQSLGNVIGQGAFTEGAVHAFLTGAFMIWTASVIVWVFLNTKHEELAEQTPEMVAAG
jgi:hypothetical protein